MLDQQPQPPPAIVAGVTAPHSARNISGAIKDVPIAELVESENNIRKHFDQIALENLANQIRFDGIKDPLEVLYHADADFGYYEVVTGARRLRAARLIGMETVPVLVVDYNKAEAIRRNFLENFKRETFTPMETARGLRLMLDEEPGLTQQVLGERIGEDQSTVSSYLRCLELPAEVIDMTDRGALAFGHIKALASLRGNPGICITLAHRSVAEGWTTKRMETEVADQHEAIRRAEREAEGQVGLPLHDAPASELAMPAPAASDALADSDLAESDVIDEDDAPAEAESDDEVILDGAPIAEAGGEDATAAPAAAPSYPLPSTPASTSGIRNVTPGAARPASTPSPAAPTTAPASAAPAVPTTPASMPAGTPQMSGITVLLPESWDDWLFEQDLTFLSALNLLKKFFPTPMTQKLVRVLNDEWRAANPAQEPMNESQALESFLARLASVKGIDLETVRGLPL